MPEFETPTPITLAAHLGAGAIDVFAEDRTTSTVEVTPFDASASSREAAERTRVELHGSTLLIEPQEPGSWLRRRGGRIRVAARIPVDSSLQMKTASAGARCQGRYATASIHSASGDVFVEEVTGEAVINTASGDARVERVGGHLRAHSASGDISVGRVDETVGAHSASGDVRLDDVGGAVNVKTASGDVRIGTARRGSVRVHSASGDVGIGVAPGTGVWLDLSSVSGSAQSDLDVANNAPEGTTAELSISVRSMSGDIDVRRAGTPTAAADGLNGEPGKWRKR
jgi:DUF4097 and DUF4098 domain-containing protein YvlB